MSELAVNQYGKAFLLPIEAKFWLVRKMSDVPRGGPLATFAEGRPIMLPIETTMDQFHAHLRARRCEPGRYRLDALDANQSPIKDVIAYLPFPPTGGIGERGDADEAPTSLRYRNVAPPAPMWSKGGAFPLPTPGHLTGAEYLLGEALRGQIAMHEATTRALVEVQASISGLVGATAELMRAADGAGLPKRKPAAPRETWSPPPQVIVQQVPVPSAYDDEQDDEEREPAPAPAPQPSGWKDKLTETVSELVPAAKMVLLAKLGGLGGAGGGAGPMDLGALLGGTPSGTDALRNAGPIDVAPAPAPPAPVDEPAPEVDVSPAAWSHLQVVATRLEPDRARALHAALGAMSPEARRAFALGLMSLRIDDACDQVVGQLAIIDARRARTHGSVARPDVPVPPRVTEETPAPAAWIGDDQDPIALDPVTAAALRVVPEVEPNPAVESGSSAPPAPADPDVAPTGTTPHALDAMARLMEILPHLSVEERATAQAIALHLPAPVRQELLVKLTAVSLDDAVKVVKGLVAKAIAMSSQSARAA